MSEQAEKGRLTCPINKLKVHCGRRCAPAWACTWPVVWSSRPGTAGFRGAGVVTQSVRVRDGGRGAVRETICRF